MLKDHFQRSISTLNVLRSEHFKVSEYLNKGKYRMKKNIYGKGKKHYDFDINSQEYFHQYIDDIIFEQTQIQEIFYNQIHKSLENRICFNNKQKIKDQSIGVRKNPSEVRVLLSRHFHNRAVDLQYKKYLTLLRVHNLGQQQHLTAVKSRTNLIDKQIQQCLTRQTRLQIHDYFQQSYTQGGKPIPINQSGQPIYKYLDEQDCWFSNIDREDIQVYLRNTLFRQEVLQDVYWPYWYQCKYLVFANGLELCEKVQDQIQGLRKQARQKIVAKCKVIIQFLQRDLEGLSPGNLQQKQNLTTFIYNITGITNSNPIQIPLYPAIYEQLLEYYIHSTKNFFKNLSIDSHQKMIEIVPKFNSFCAILFKYQNQQILQGQKQIKLGLQDQIDIKKQLITMLQEQWVTKHVQIAYDRFQYKMYLKFSDWSLDTYSARLEKQIRQKNQNGYAPDSSLQELIRVVRMAAYNGFRKIMKKRSQRIIGRIKTKYEDMQLVQKYSTKSDQQINMQKLSDLYEVKQGQITTLFKKSIKQSTKKFFDLIISDHLIKNPVQIQIAESLSCIRIRQMRTKILNILNAFRSYQRNINMDLRVIDGCEFKFELDDNFLINSNKQVIERFQKNVKQNQTSMSKLSKAQSNLPTLDSQQFLIHGTHEKTMLYKKDKIQRHYYNQKIPHIFVLDGKRKRNILYDVALQDLKLIQQRILQIGTHFINRYQRAIKMKQLPELVDRVNILSQLYELQQEYLYEKFNLIESYYYLYENTTEPLNCNKIAKIIIEIIYQQPKIDLNSEYYKYSYMNLIENFKQQIKIIKQFTKMIQDEQKDRNKVFHKKFSQMCQIPLTLWAYAYGDMQVKGGKTYNKLQRMNSVSSKMSKNSKQKNVINQLRQQIRQQFGQDDQEQQQVFDIQKYDQYLLKRNMDDIFDDIVGGNDNQKNQDKDAGIGVSSLGLQNLTINPKFQGGPHTLHNYLPQVKITSNNTQKLINFSEHICIVSNMHYLIKQLTKQAKQRYGFCSQNYQLSIKKHICKFINKILLQPSPTNNNANKVQKFYQFKTDDIYLQTVTTDSKHFQQVMTPILQLPSLIQLSIPATHQKHQASFPSLQILYRFDVSILNNYIKLEKPVNSAVYRQLNLGINLLEFVKMRRKLWHIQNQREQLCNAYKILGLYCQIPIQKYTNCYGRTGQSQIFLATSQIKSYSPSFTKRPTFNQSIDQLRTYCELQQIQLKFFHTNIQICKQYIEDYIRIIWDIEKQQTVNKILNKNQILRSNDKKTVKMVSNRIKGYISLVSSQLLKNRSYLKQKNKLKTILQDKLRILSQNTPTIQQQTLKTYLNNDPKKYPKTCQTILTQKIKKLLTLEHIKKYTKDLQHNIRNNEIFIDLLRSTKQIRKYVQSLPYLSKIFIMPTQFQVLNKKAFDDQKKIKVVQHQKSKEELLDNWRSLGQNAQMSISSNNLKTPIPLQNFIKDQLAPPNKDQIFKWMFKIPTNTITQTQKQSLRHILKIHEPFTGKLSLSQYRYSCIQQGTRNKFSSLLDRYTIILEYIQSNLLLISLQVDDDILDSVYSIIDHGYIFEERYPLLDEGVIYQMEQTTPRSQQQQKQQLQQKSSITTKQQQSKNRQSIMAPCFIYENKKDQLQKKLNIKITSRGYVENKLHWAVIDEIIDFIVSKVQGYGVFRHTMLELKDQLELFGKNRGRNGGGGGSTGGNQIKLENVLKYMRNKTENIYNILWLALWQLNTQSTHNKNPNNPNTNQYCQLFLDTLVPKPKLEPLQVPLSMNMNIRRGISNFIEYQDQKLQQQKIKFNKGIYQLKNDILTNKLKVVYQFLPFSTQEIIEEYVYKSEKFKQKQKQKQKDREMGGYQSNQLYLLRHNWNNLSNFRQLIKKPGKQFRYKLFAKARELFIQGKKFISTKIQTSDPLQLLQLQQKKVQFYQYLTYSKINMLALTAFKMAKFSESFPKGQQNMYKQFNQILQKNRQIVEIGTYNIYDNLQDYQNSGKIIFTKIQSAIIAKGTTKKNQIIQQSNKLIRMVIFNKLVNQQFKNQILQTAIKLLQNQKLPKKQADKIKNTSLIPRVHLISSYSSPLIIQRKTYISQKHKLAFVQAFINRFRNKVSRVDLLSSGYGFVITVPDLQDCVNYMNKLLFTFTQKQFRVRLDTFSQYYQILMDGLRSRNQTINQQKVIIKHLQDKLKNTLEADYLSKVSKLLQEKVVIQQKLILAQQAANGLQQRVRKTIKHQYETKITSLQKQNQKLKAQFDQYKDLLIKLTKDTTKINFLSLVNILKQQVGQTLDKKIDLSQSFKSISEVNVQSQPKIIKVKQQQVKQSSKQKQQQKDGEQLSLQYGQEDIQKCKIGQDIIHDPYYVTKLINKMRLFNLFKMGAKRIKYQQKQEKKIGQLTSLHKIQDRVIVQNQRQVILRNQLIKAQEDLSKKSVELQKIRHMVESLQNQKAKLKILLVSKQKKLQQKQRQNQQYKKKFQDKSAELIKIQSKASSQKNIPLEEQRKLSAIRQQKKSRRRVNETFVTNLQQKSAALSLYQKFELSNKDSTWRQKCEQLYLQNKRLLNQVQKLKESVSGTTTPYTREGHSLNLRNKRTAQQSDNQSSRTDKRKFPNLSFKYGVMKN